MWRKQYWENNTAKDVYKRQGPEIAVATTKAYSTQLVAGYILTLKMAQVRGAMTEEKVSELLTEMQTLPEKIGRIIEDKDRIQWFASKFANAKDIFFIGRGIDYSISLEGSLKTVSYTHLQCIFEMTGE